VALPRRARSLGTSGAGSAPRLRASANARGWARSASPHGTRTGASTTRNPTMLFESPGVKLPRPAERQLDAE